MTTLNNVPVDELMIPKWGTTHILRPDMLVLADSIGNYGVLSPLIVQKSKRLIIDGSQRVLLIRGNKHLNEKCGGEVPVVWVDVDELDAMIMHVQLNRGRGSILAKKLSGIVRTLDAVKKFDEKDFSQRFAIKPLELELMRDATIIKHRDIKNHTYSRAWVPVEAPPGTVERGPGITIEAPPGEDR